MPWIGPAIGLVGGLISSSSASDAAETQSNAASNAAQAQLQASREANQLTADMYKSGLANQAPGLQGGQLALSALMSGLGLGNAQAAPGAGGAYGAAPVMGPAGTYTNAAGQPVDAQGNVITQGSNYGIAGLNYGATQDQLNAAGNPYAGTFNEQFTPNDLTLDPSYQWRLEQGARLLRAQQAAGGNRFSGQAMKDITNYGQNAASQEYSAANDRFLKNKSLLFDRLSGIAGIGSAAGNAASAAGQGAASQIGANTMAGAGAASNYLTSGAAAQAAGQVGSTNALVGGANSALNNYYTMQYLNGQGQRNIQPVGGYGSAWGAVNPESDGRGW